MHRLQELVRLHRLGGSGPRAVAATLGMSPNTERRYRIALTAAGLLVGAVEDLPEVGVLRAAVARELPRGEPPKQQESSISRWESKVKDLRKKGLGPKAIHDRLRLEEEEYRGRVGAVKRMVRRLRIEAGVSADEIVIPVETKAGHVAQVDFGYAGYLWDPETGRQRRAWLFVMVLGYSRHMYVEYVFDQSAETWVRVHINAFRELGGVPAEIVPDNLKAAVLKAAFSTTQDSTLNRTYRELGRHYGFKIGPTPARSPKKKGKVESGVKYVKGNFGKGRDGDSIVLTNAEVARWVREIAGTRDHGATGKAPLAVFLDEEQGALLPLPRDAYRVVVWHKATLHQDGHFHFDGRLYSVPWQHVAPKGAPHTVVWARATATTVTAYINDERVTDHDRHGPGRRATKDEHLPEHRRDHRHRDPEYWLERASVRGPSVRALIAAVLDFDPAKSRVDVACNCLRLLEGLPAERSESVARHALEYGNVHFGEIKRIVDQKLEARDYAAPREQVSHGWGEAWPTFARHGEDFLESTAWRQAEASGATATLSFEQPSVQGEEGSHGSA